LTTRLLSITLPEYEEDCMSTVLRFKREELIDYVVSYMGKLGVPEDDARIIGDVLIEADCRGVKTHGLIRLATYYGNRLKKGYMDPLTPVTMVKESENTALMDGGNGCGQVASHKAMSLCIEKAKKANMAIVTVRNSNHYGIAAYYAMMALKHNMIGISLTNSQPLAAPTYGRTAVLGTNPISVAVPTSREYPYLLDMATSTVPIGRIKVYEKKGEKIPLGWALDDDGIVTDDPKKVQSGGPGALMPLGGTDIMSGYKGYSLAFLVEILCGVLSGGNFLTNVGFPHEPQPSGVAHFFMAFKIDAFQAPDAFKQQMDSAISLLKNAPLAKDQSRIYIAGEKEFEAAEENRKKGVPIMSQVIEDLRKAGEDIGVPFDVQALAL
jgi:L-2-hydroxycarboxylate dehydrogenase (NAD+)